MGEKELYIALNMIPKLGPIRIMDIVSRIKTFEAFVKADRFSLLNIPGINEKLCDIILEYRQRVDPYIEINRAEKLGAKIVTLDDQEYPYLLKNIYDPPPVIYIKGDLSALNNETVAIVGTRKATYYGKTMAINLARELASFKINVVSGLARGIDSYAHKGALEAGGPTTAVLGCGIDIIYPPENADLAAKICDNGCLITSFHLGTKPLPANFPARNRIISGLSLGTVVVEATEKSGSLITADFSLEQGREIFAVPGNIMSPYSRGPHKLLKMGAKLVENVEDIIEELNLNQRSAKNNDEKDKTQILSSDELNILNLIDYQPISIEQILIKSQKNTQELNTLLSILEVKGLIALTGGYVVRVK